MSVPTFPCPSGETCFAPECCAHQECMHAQEAQSQQEQQAPRIFEMGFIQTQPAEPTDTEILDFIEARARWVWGEEGAWSSAGVGTPSMCPRDEDTFIYPTLRDSVKAEMLQDGWKRNAPPAETPLSECQNPECPVGCPDSHAATPAYFAMADEPAPWDAIKASMDLEHSLLRAALVENSEPDEPVVTEVPRG